MTLFSNEDVDRSGTFPTIYLHNYYPQLVYAPLDWQKRGLHQTASGYGAKLTNSYKINYCGRLYRLYTTIWSNVGSTWFTVKGERIYIN